MTGDKKLSQFYIEQEYQKIKKVLNIFNFCKTKYKGDPKYWELLGFLKGKLAMIDEIQQLFDL